ncbi:DegT/DnrJ/EryC1/StrS family aminotransferase [Priestia abyssalis]|uniref:DegT/DnrJ/EryC1/StrS family aminotransferase n=1 Tax=Priestia abyssalis TaxID=1221450 RepID=UPI0009959A76|nr:DegT/DnrJ/EryC1/StrS family aminotransferase [Priestia abyssalis]
MTKRINVTKPFLPPIEQFIKKIEEIWENNWLTNNGPLHEQFEKGVVDYLKVRNACLFTNGHLALDVAIKSLDLKGEVITTPFTFASTVHTITMNGLTPVFCDIELGTFNIDINKIEELITEKTSAIIPVHVFGNLCNVKAIEKIAQKYNLKVIYDAAHTFGVELNGRGIGSYGNISMFSLHATKVFHSIEGGVLSFNDGALKEKLNKYKNFGISGEEQVDVVGLNAKMNEFQAAMGLVNLSYIDEQIEKRKKATYAYRNNLKDIEGLRYLEDQEGVKHNYAYFPIIINESIFGMNRDSLHEKLQDFNIFTRKYFYPLCTDFNCYDFNSNELLNAKFVSKNILTLPLYSDLSIDEVLRICETIKSIQKEKMPLLQNS